MKISFYFYVVILAFAISSCRDDSDNILCYAKGYESSFAEADLSFEKQFEAFWTAMNCNYPIWDYEERFGLDWDAVYDKYISKFKELDTRDSVSNREIEEIYKEILSPLHDGHFQVAIKNHTAKGADNTITIFPAQIRNKKRADYDIDSMLHYVSFLNHDYYFHVTGENKIEEHLIASGYLSNSNYKYYLFSDNIVYLKEPECNLCDVFASSDTISNKMGFSDREYAQLQEYIEHNKQIKKVWYKWFNKIQELHYAKTLKGVIIDLRNNHGGDSKDYQYTLGALQSPDYVLPNNSKVKHIGYERYKIGIGRYDYSNYYKYLELILQEEHSNITEPIVILTNTFTGSQAEITCLGATSTNVTIVGTQTWGGFSGTSDDYTFSYSGPVGEKDYSGLRTPFYAHIPSYTFLNKNKEIMEGNGIIPDIKESFNSKLYEETGRDNQLERALECIRTGK